MSVCRQAVYTQEQQKRRNGGTAEWREWQYGGKNGRMAEWQKWLHTYYLRQTHTDDDDTDDDTLIFYSIDNTRKNEGRIDYDYKVGQKALVRREGILHKSESIWHRKPWLIASVHTNGTITVQRGNKLEQMNIRRVKPFVENLDNE